MSQIKAPFTKEQIENLKEWQTCGMCHPYTCCDHIVMKVKEEGLYCPRCGMVQTWAHDFKAPQYKTYEEFLNSFNKPEE